MFCLIASFQARRKKTICPSCLTNFTESVFVCHFAYAITSTFLDLDENRFISAITHRFPGYNVLMISYLNICLRKLEPLPIEYILGLTMLEIDGRKHIQRFLVVTQNKYENMSHFQFHQITLSKMRSLEVALFGLEDRILVEGRTAVAVKKLALPVDVVVGVSVLRNVVVRVRPDELLPPIPFVAI